MPRRQGFKPGMLGRRMWSFARARIQRYAADFPLDVEDSSLPLAENVSWEEPREEAPAPNEPPVVTARPARSTQEFPSTPRPAAPASSTPPPLARNVPPPAPPAPPTPAPPRTTPRAAAPSATPPPVQRVPAAPPTQRPAASAPPVSAPRPAAPSLRPAAPTPQTAEVRRQPAQSRPSNQPQEYKIEPHLLRILEAHEQKADDDAAQAAAAPPAPAPSEAPRAVQRAAMPRKGLMEEITPKSAPVEDIDTGEEPWEQEVRDEAPEAFVEEQHEAPVEVTPPSDAPQHDVQRSTVERTIHALSRYMPPAVEDDGDYIPTPLEETEAMPLPAWDDEPVAEAPEIDDDEPTLPTREGFMPPAAPPAPAPTPPAPSQPSVQREPMPDLPPSFFAPATMASTSGDVSLPTLEDESDRETEQVDYNSGAASNLLNPFHRADLRRQEVDNLLETIRRAESPSPSRTPEAPREPARRSLSEIQRAPGLIIGDDEPADEGEQPHLFEALMDAGMVKGGRRVEPQPPTPRTRSQSVQRKEARAQELSDDDAYDAAVPDEGSVEADLLSLLDMPADTPVVGLRKQAPPRTVSRESYIEDAEWQPHDNGAPQIQQRVQREEAATPAQAAQPASSAGGASSTHEEGQEADGPNIDKLAREVFRLLRGRLRVEQERRTDK